MRNLHAFVNDEAESWMVALETVRGLGQQKTKVLSAGSTLAVTQVSVKKKSIPVKCKVCSKYYLTCRSTIGKSTRITSLLQLLIPLP